VIVTVTRPPSKPFPYDKAFTFSQVALGWHYGTKQDYKLVEFGTEALNLYLNGKLNPMVEKVISFDDIKNGLTALRDRHSRGKTVVKVIE
jgi:NADPH2:quinone reductase